MSGDTQADSNLLDIPQPERLTTRQTGRLATTSPFPRLSRWLSSTYNHAWYCAPFRWFSYTCCGGMDDMDAGPLISPSSSLQAQESKDVGSRRAYHSFDGMAHSSSNTSNIYPGQYAFLEHTQRQVAGTRGARQGEGFGIAAGPGRSLVSDGESEEVSIMEESKREKRSNGNITKSTSRQQSSIPPRSGPNPNLSANRMDFDKHCAGLVLYNGGEVLLILRNSNNNDLTWDFPGGQIDAEDFDKADIAARSRASLLQGQVQPTPNASSGALTSRQLPASQTSRHMSVPLYEDDKVVKGYDPYLYGPGSVTWNAAIREATEELGLLPGSLTVITIHNLVRSWNTKRYTLYICKVSDVARERFTPRLSEEHVAWGWFPCLVIRALELSTTRYDGSPESFSLAVHWVNQRGTIGLSHSKKSLKATSSSSSQYSTSTSLPQAFPGRPLRFEVHPWVDCFLDQHASAWRELSMLERLRQPVSALRGRGEGRGKSRQGTGRRNSLKNYAENDGDSDRESDEEQSKFDFSCVYAKDIATILKSSKRNGLGR